MKLDFMVYRNDEKRTINFQTDYKLIGLSNFCSLDDALTASIDIESCLRLFIMELKWYKFM